MSNPYAQPAGSVTALDPQALSLPPGTELECVMSGPDTRHESPFSRACGCCWAVRRERILL